MSDANTNLGCLVDRSVKWARVDARHDAVAGLTVAVTLPAGPPWWLDLKPLLGY